MNHDSHFVSVFLPGALASLEVSGPLSYGWCCHALFQ